MADILREWYRRWDGTEKSLAEALEAVCAARAGTPVEAGVASELAAANALNNSASKPTPHWDRTEKGLAAVLEAIAAGRAKDAPARQEEPASATAAAEVVAEITRAEKESLSGAKAAAEAIMTGMTPAKYPPDTAHGTLSARDFDKLNSVGPQVPAWRLAEANDEITRLRGKIARLKKALKGALA